MTELAELPSVDVQRNAQPCSLPARETAREARRALPGRLENHPKEVGWLVTREELRLGDRRHLDVEEEVARTATAAAGQVASIVRKVAARAKGSAK